jgi:hypothetical protein
MKSKDLKKLAILGIAGSLIMSQGAAQADEAGTDILPGLMAAGCGAGSCGGYKGSKGSSPRGEIADANDDRMQSSGQMLTEDQLMSQLSVQGRQMYSDLTPEGKALALRLASQSNISDKNMAVKMAAKQAAGSFSGGNYNGQ